MDGLTVYVEDKMIFLPITCTPDWAVSRAISGMYWSSSVHGRRSDDFYWQKWELYFIFIREVIDFLLLCGVDLYRLALYVV